jgi:uncharacterized sulfatase
LDWSVGRILSRLRELGLDERTLVIFTSDNGPWFGGSTGGLRGMKGQTWEGGTRVPMIARWPGTIPAGRVCRAPAGTIDIFPTLLKAAGVALPADRVIDGKDIMTLLTSEATSPHEALFAMHGPRLMTVRSGKWKLHVLPPPNWPRNRKDLDDWLASFIPDGVTILAPYEQCRSDEDPDVRTGDPPEEMMLFDLEADPAEQHSVAGEHPDVVRRLTALFDRLKAQVPEPPPKGKTRQKRPGT